MAGSPLRRSKALHFHYSLELGTESTYKGMSESSRVRMRSLTTYLRGQSRRVWRDSLTCTLQHVTLGPCNSKVGAVQQ